MKIMQSSILFALGCAAGAGALKGMEALNKNKFQVKKRINDAIDSVTK